jgi:hypothetical protein
LTKTPGRRLLDEDSWTRTPEKGFGEAILSDGAENLIGQRLQNAIDLMAEQANLVELWACALGGFAQPIPPYDPDDRYRLGAMRN